MWQFSGALLVSFSNWAIYKTNNKDIQDSGYHKHVERAHDILVGGPEVLWMLFVVHH